MKKIFKQFSDALWDLRIFILVLLVINLILLIDLPYYIYAPGEIEEINQQYEMEKAYPSKGSINTVYVTSYDADVALYILSFFIPSWELVKDNQVRYEKESDDDAYVRSRLSLEVGVQNAVKNAYQLADKLCEIKDQHQIISYIDEAAVTDLKIGDEVLKINDIKVESFAAMKKVIATKEVGDTVAVQVLRNGKKKELSAEIIELYGEKVIGIAISEIYDLTTKPEIKVKVKSSEVGGSGGLMTALSIYDALKKEDLTKGYVIAGTGTLDEEGNVGEIGSIEKKIQTAVNSKTDIFFVPKGNNYKAAKKLVTQKKYKIILVPVDTFEQAVEYLENLK